MRLHKVGVLSAVALLLFTSFNISTPSFGAGTILRSYSVFASGDYERTYTIHNDYGYSISYSISIPEETYHYYRGLSHNWYSYSDLEKFVTPEMFKDLVPSLSKVCTTDSSFVSAVLEIVQQIPYEEHTRELYPIETMVENAGDCSDKSYVAASFLLEKGYYTVLLFFESERHMAIGIALSNFRPEYTVWYHEYEGRAYYYCECTSPGWKIGQVPSELEGIGAQVIELKAHTHEISPRPLLPVDSDGDGLADDEELQYGTSPYKKDTDNDGLSDYYEVFISHTDPTKVDSDNDGLNDGAEIDRGTDPLISDSDGDGLSDGKEISLGTDPLRADTDNDGWVDSIDLMPTNFLVPNFIIIAVSGGIVVLIVLVVRRKHVPPQQPRPSAPLTYYCPSCGSELTYIEQYQRWYCSNCKKYV